MNAHTGAEQSFTDYLADLVRREDRAALAVLRRGLGKSPGQAADMFPYVMPFISDRLPERRQDDYFLVASLFAAHQMSWPATSEGKGFTNLGTSFRRLRAAVDSGSIEKRFVALLNAEREELPEHLRHAISLLKAHDIPVDWFQLLRDLAGWDWENRRIQRAWSLAFWGEMSPMGSTKS